ncbi:MAG TPA: hypothetical protein ENN39_06470 [Desulfonatronum sp.]|nr:hypothetical protein [Desulfonatronum sp.]
MGYFNGQLASVPLDEHVKILEDEELLDFWEESQYMEGILEGEYAISPQIDGGYERLILQEIRLRFCRRDPAKTMPGN